MCASVATHELAGASITLYPNPASTVLMIEVEGLLDYRVRMFDMNEKLVYEKENQGFVPTGHLHNGTYLLEITDLSSGQRIIEKVVVAK